MTLIRAREYTFRAQVADHWRRGNVFLLGDAAHLTPPFIGQGMGAGLRDAMNLAWKISGVLQGALPESALETYQQERKRHARSMIRFAVMIAWVMTAGGRAGDEVRRHLLPRLQPVASAAGAAVTPPLRGSTLVRRSHRLRDLAGSLCPNPVIEEQRLDDAVGNRVAVISSHRLGARLRNRLHARGVVVVEVAADSDLGVWLRQGRAHAAVVRPDRTVLTAARSVDRVDELFSAALTITKEGQHEHVRR